MTPGRVAIIGLLLLIGVGLDALVVIKLWNHTVDPVDAILFLAVLQVVWGSAYGWVITKPHH